MTTPLHKSQENEHNLCGRLSWLEANVWGIKLPLTWFVSRNLWNVYTCASVLSGQCKLLSSVLTLASKHTSTIGHCIQAKIHECDIFTSVSNRKSRSVADNVCVQDTSELFRDARKLARSETSHRKAKLMEFLLVDCAFVQLVQKMWQQCLRPELLEKDDDLPDHILTSLGVKDKIFDEAVCLLTITTLVKTQECVQI